MSKFTAGPWEVDHDGDEVAVVMGSAIDGPNEYYTAHRWICETEWHDEDDEAEANARLIAAAPDLLEALIMCCQSIISVLPDFNPFDQAAYDKSRAAIAKATGETQ